MVQRRAKQRGLNQEALNQMSDEDLLQTYFANGGFMTKEGFTQPAPISRETSAVCFSLCGLLRTKSGHRLIIKTLAEFDKRKIDKYGKPVKKVKVIQHKPRLKKQISSHPPRKASDGKGGKSGKSGQTKRKTGK